MRGIRLTGLAISILLGYSGVAVSAQNTNPPGPFLETCTDVSVKNGNLYATCKDDKGKPHSAKLSAYEKCSTAIINKNGSLECPHAGSALPPGSYTDSCRKIQMKGTTLRAVCKNMDGRDIETFLKDATSCSQGVINVNGFLNCAMNDVLPPGSYLATCKDIRVQSGTLYASCNNGKDQWLDATMSDVHKCTGDIANQEGTLHCTEIKKVERR